MTREQPPYKTLFAPENKILKVLRLTFIMNEQLTNANFVPTISCSQTPAHWTDRKLGPPACDEVEET